MTHIAIYVADVPRKEGDDAPIQTFAEIHDSDNGKNEDSPATIFGRYIGNHYDDLMRYAVEEHAIGRAKPEAKKALELARTSSLKLVNASQTGLVNA